MAAEADRAQRKDFAAVNRERLFEYFRAGEKGSGKLGLLGLEVEHHVVGDDGSAISYEPHDGRVGVREVLAELAAGYPDGSYNAHRDLLGLTGPDGAVSLEPAAQLEISVAPFSRIDDVAQAYRRFRGIVDPFLAHHDAHLLSQGYHPTRRAQELTLIPKQRYDFMDEYFATIGSHGDRMMRGSASTQVSVDFADEADAVRKMRVSAALAPILAAIADNTPVFEGEPNHVPIRRLQLWREVDNLRCGTVPGIFESGFGYSAYSDWLLATPPIFVTRPAADNPAGDRLRPFFSTPAAEAYADAPMEQDDIEHLASIFWPDVRLKHFVEVRPADSMPEDCVLGYTALVKGLFYSADSLAAVEDALGVDPAAAAARAAWPIEKDDVDAAIARVQAHGFAGDVYGRDLLSWEDLLFSLARNALPEGERHYLTALESHARTKPWWEVAT